MQVVNISEAKAQLSALIAQLEECGEDLIIARAGKPAAKLIAYEAKNNVRNRIGFAKGTIEIADDFDEMPEDMERAFGMIK